MKDAKGHGSNARGGSYQNIDKNLRGAGKHTGYGGNDVFHIQKSNGPKSDWYSAVGQKSGQVLSAKGLGGISDRLSGLQHVAGIAEAHSIPTGHLNSQGHAYGSPEAIRDFTKQYGGPRDHAAEARGFNRGWREINRLARKGK